MVNTLIIQACKRKEHNAFKQCYEACAPYVYTIIRNYINNEDDRKDAMQEAFAHIFNSIHRFDEKKGKFKSWISQITINQCINLLKQKNKLALLVPLEEKHNPAALDELEIEGLNKALLEKLLAKMPTGYRTIFLLNLVEGYSHNEIAEILQITPETSRSQLSRAIKWMRKHYTAHLKSITYG